MIVLPLILILISIATGEAPGIGGWIGFAAKLSVLGPLIGVGIAQVSVTAMARLRKRHLIRRDYESIYSFGVSFLAFAAAQLVGGSGFIAAFAAGLTIALIDEELCDCFLEYGETSAEMAMLLTFVFIGAALIRPAADMLGVAAIVFAVFALVIARPLPFMILLRRSRASLAGKQMIFWFGLRGFNSLLLAVLAIAAGAPKPEYIFAIVSLVVVLSMIVHGASATPVLSWYGRSLWKSDLSEEIATDVGTLLNVGVRSNDPSNEPRMPVEELKRMMDDALPVTVIDVRRESAYDSSGLLIPGSLRIPIDEIAERIWEIPRGAPVVLSFA